MPQEVQGTIIVDDATNTQHTGTHRFTGGSKFVICDATDATKTVVFNLSGLTTGTETEFTVPESDSAIVTLTATQQLQNKTVLDSTFSIADNTTPTKIAKFECSGLSEATSTFTFPDGGGTLMVNDGADFVVNVSDDVEITSGGDTFLTSVATMVLDVGSNLTATVDGSINLSSADEVVIEGTGAGDDVILQTPYASSRIFINGGLTLVRATTAVSASTAYQPIMAVTDNSAQRTITLEADTNLAGRIQVVKDEAGTAGTTPIIVIPESGNIDGGASFLINDDGGCAMFYGDATNWKYMGPGALNQALNASKIGAVAAPGSGTTAVIIRRLGNFFELTFTLTAARISVTDDGVNGSFGALKLFDFVQGGISYLGSRQNYTAYTPDGTGVPDDTVFEIGLGTTAIAAAADGVLAANQDDIGGDVNQTLSGGTTTGTGMNGAAGTFFDGTGSAGDIYLNWSGTAATVDGNGTIDVTATFTVVGCFLGDD